MKQLLSLYICCTAFAIQAQIYQGTIGKHTVILEISDKNEENVRASYFYESQLKNIFLEGKPTQFGYIFNERYAEKEEKKEFFTLKTQGENLEGIWQNGEQQLSVILTKSELNVENFRIERMIYIRDSIATYNTKEIVWFHEKYSKQILFRLGNGFTKTQRDSINSMLDKIHQNYVLDDFYCGYAEYTPEVSFVSNNYVSITGFYSTYCWGAHPNHGTLAYNFNLKTGKRISKINEVYPNLNY